MTAFERVAGNAINTPDEDRERAVRMGEQLPDGTVAVFVMSRRTTPKLLRVLWLMSEADARKVCSDPRTASQNSALHWTAEYGKQGEDWAYTPDDGRYNDVLAELGVTVTGPRSGLETVRVKGRRL